jgi:MFS transporter, ACS family, solute carrier family 17 (sodium-dependent inorganic phosphate cotransporter), other
MLFTGPWQRRYTIVGLGFAATFICYIDRVNISVAIIPMAADLGWDATTQGTVLSSFFVGYLLTQIVGGRLADRFGGKVVLAGGVLLWSLFTIVTPPAAAFGFAALLVARVGMGMGEGVNFPAVYTLQARWIPIDERARAMALNNSGIPLGTVFALVVTPIIVAQLGWQWAFYLFGSVGIVWFAVWQTRTAASPAEHPRISAAELDYIQAHSTPAGVPGSAPPILAFLKHPSVWAIIVAHFCNNWSLYVLLTWLPTFVNKGLGVSFASVGFFTMFPHIAYFVFLNVAGNVADRLIRGGMEVGRVRKLMQSIGFGGVATALVIVGHVDNAPMAIAIMTLGNGIFAFTAGGFFVNHMDIAPRSAGTLMGITNTAATIPGIIGVYVSGMILDATGSWAFVFNVAAGVALFGLAFYLVFASGKKVFD